MTFAITYADITAAAQRLQGVAFNTPVLTSHFANELSGAELFFKCENLQKVGAFKFRGAYNAISLLSPAQKAAGVVAYSSGNHAQAMALAAREQGIKAVIVMPQDAPALKIANTREYGAEVVLYNRYTESREAIAQKFADERGLSLIPPFDLAPVIAGQGTAAKELFESVGELDYLLVTASGGGLLAGCALAASVLSPKCEVWGVEPEAGNDIQQSFASGRRVKIEVPKTIADGAQTQQVGELTFPLIQKYVKGIVTATDVQLIAGVKFLAQRLKIVVEPTGALPFAAALNGSLPLKGKRVGVLISGGNLDLSDLAKYVTSA